jgi:hypothetical protein
MKRFQRTINGRNALTSLAVFHFSPLIDSLSIKTDAQRIAGAQDGRGKLHPANPCWMFAASRNVATSEAANKGVTRIHEKEPRRHVHASAVGCLMRTVT